MTVKCCESVSRQCKYGVPKDTGSGLCDYIGIEGHSRPCPGKACTCFVPLTTSRRQNKRYQNFVANKAVNIKK